MLRRRDFSSVAFILGLTLVGVVPAAASVQLACGSNTCTIPGDDGLGSNFLEANYTIPPAGRTYRWTFTYSDAAPDAVVTLTSPNQTDLYLFVRGPDGIDTVYDPSPNYRFEEFIVPGVRTDYLVAAPANFYFCDQPGPIGEVCGRDAEIFGNAAFLTNSSAAPVTVTFTESVVPEPAGWVMLIVGFGVLGGVLRRDRRLIPAGGR